MTCPMRLMLRLCERQRGVPGGRGPGWALAAGEEAEARWPTKLDGSDSSGPDGAGKVAGGQAQGARGQAARWPEERARCPAK